METPSGIESGRPRWPARFARGSIGTSAAFMVMLGALHIFRPDLAPSWHFISEYEVGDYGWMMRAAFFALAISCAGVLVALFPHARGIAGRLGLLLLSVSAFGMTLGEPALRVYFLPLPPLFLLMLTGLYLFVLPFAAGRRNARRAAERCDDY